MKVEVNDTASAALAAIAARVGSMKPLMVMMGHHMENSVRRNFNQGGRPDVWTQLKNVTVLPRGSRKKNARVQGRQRMGGPLVLTGDLRGTIGFTAEDADLILWARPSRDPVKAPVQQWGTDRAGRNHATVIPARRYLVFQREDLEWFKRSLAGWVRVGSGGVAE